jgi:hypothetical protein
METGKEQRHSFIYRTRTRRHSDDHDVLQLWRPLASHLVLIIGEGGVHALIARSLYLTRASFPWLETGHAPRAANVLLANLKNCLEAQNTVEASKASHMLLLTFTDLLASLVGEPLTISILRSVWGDDAPEDHPRQEPPHD